MRIMQKSHGPQYHTSHTGKPWTKLGTETQVGKQAPMIAQPHVSFHLPPPMDFAPGQVQNTRMPGSLPPLAAKPPLPMEQHLGLGSFQPSGGQLPRNANGRSILKRPKQHSRLPGSKVKKSMLEPWEAENYPEPCIGEDAIDVVLRWRETLGWSCQGDRAASKLMFVDSARAGFVQFFL